MFRRGLAILLCSAMLVGSLPETSFAAENVETTETVEAETQENGDSPETEENAQTSKAAVSETQTVAETEKTETKETKEAETKETEKKETETKEAEKTETKAAEGNEDALEDSNETVAQETETKETEKKETETVANPMEDQIVIETTMETQETIIVGLEEESKEEMTEEETIEEVSAEEIENAAQQDEETFGNEYVTVSNVKVTYNSISFDYQRKNSDIRYVYVLSDSKYIDSYSVYGGGSIVITGLNPETEYEIDFCAYDNNDKYYSFSKTTAECPYNVTYGLSSTKADTIRLTADITAKEGAEYELPERFILNWSCVDADGKVLFDGSTNSRNMLNGSLPVTITCDIKNALYIFGNTTYTFDVSIGEYGKNTQFAKESGKEVTTSAPAISDMDVSFKQNETNPSTGVFTITTGNYTDRVVGVIFWRLKGSNVPWADYRSCNFEVENGSTTGEAWELSIGSTYEYLINAEGFKKTGEFTNGEAKLKWKMSHDVGAIDDVITFQIDEATKTQGATYEVWGSYRQHVESEYDGDIGGELYGREDSENIYIASPMHPNTEYEIQFTIWEKLPNGSENTYTAFETVTTKASAVQTNITRTYLDAVRFQIAFDSSIRTEYFDDVTVYPYVKNQDGTYTRIENADSIYLHSNNYDASIYDLESNKEYEITFCNYNEYSDVYYEYGTMTFKTPADDRTITIDTPEAGIGSLTVKGTFQGSALPYDSTVIYLLYKENSSDKWQRGDYTYCEVGEGVSSAIEQRFTLSTSLESGKSYDYAVGIGTEGKYDIDSLKGVKKGTITLRPDERSVEITDTTPLLDGVVVKAKLLGRYIDDYNEATMFYREKGSTDASWMYDSRSLYFDFYDDARETYSFISGLESGKTYEYKLCVGNYPRKEEDYASLNGGEFTYTRPADDRTLEATVTEKRTQAEFAVTLAGSSRAESNYITVFYREKGTTSWRFGSSSSIYWSDNQPLNLTISGLTGGKEYEYVAGISNGYISSVDDIVTGKKEGTFTTKDERKFAGEPTIATGYNYADFAVTVDGLNGESSYVYFYTKDTSQENAGWVEENPRYIYSDNNTANFSLSSLTQGTAYDYAFVISDNYRGISPDSEEFTKLSADRKLVGKFITKNSPYTLEISENDKSVYNEEILNLKVTSSAEFDEKNFYVSLNVVESESNDRVYNRSINLNSVDQTGEAIITSLSEKTKYDVTGTLYARVMRNGQFTNVRVATKTFSFTTKAAEAPTEIKLSTEEVWLNWWSDYYYQNVSVTVADGASNEVKWTSSDENVAYAVNGRIIAGGKTGEATITATSVLNLGATATVKVHSDGYGVVFTDTKEFVDGVSACANTKSTNVAYVKISESTDGGKTYPYQEGVKATGTSDDPRIAYWDENEQCIIAKNVGSTWIVLTAEGKYKMDLYVSVYGAPLGFDVKIYDYSSSYPAIKTSEGNYQIAVGQDYELYAVANPKTVNYEISDVLKYTSSDTSILTVSSYGYVQGLKKGTATVTVAYDTDAINALAKEYPSDPELKKLVQSDLTKTKSVTFDVRPTTSQGLPEVHAITNIHKTLAEAIGTLGEGWKLRDPDTSLYSLPTGGNNVYEFEAEYTGNDYYPYEGKAKVYISTITGVNVINNNSSVISSDGKDALNLTINPIVSGYTGLVEGKDYTVEIPAVANLTIAQDTAGYKITASKKGKYTLKPEIKVGGTVVATGSYVVTVADGKLIDHIDVEADTDNQNVTIKGSTIYFDTNAGVESFKLKATAYDREGAVSTDTKLAWTITDKSVADIDTKTSDRDVTVKIKDDGHAVIQVTAGDDAKASAKFNVEVRNYKPRVEGADKVTINTAYDYTETNGRSLSARQYGIVSVTAVYRDSIESIDVVSTDVEDGAKDLNGKVSKEFRYDESYDVIMPVSPDQAAGKYNLKLAVTTSSGFIYTYPLAITVMNKEPKVSAKISKVMNLFYLNDRGFYEVTLEKNKSKGTDYNIESLTWSNGIGEGFKFSGSYTLPKTPNVKRYFIDGSAVKVSNGKLVNANAASGTVTIKLSGVRKTYELPVTVKYSYKKPKLTTADYMTGKNTSTILPSLSDGKYVRFYILGDNKSLIDYDELRNRNDKVTIDRNGNVVSAWYYGTEEKFDIPLTIDSYNWREALTITHKVKAAKPTAVLGNAKLIYNTKYDNAVETSVYLKDYTYAIVSAVDVTGADQVSYDLLTSGKLQITTDGGWVTARLNASRLEGSLPKAATYVLTPYCVDAATGESTALNTLTLKISFTDKPVIAKISGKGKLDLAVGTTSYGTSADAYAQWLQSNSIIVTPKFTNLGTGYYVTDAELTGEYSKYFTLHEDNSSSSTRYIKISSTGRGKLKAGQNYNLSIIYTLEDMDGNQITVKSSNVLKVKPTQKAPKITVVGDNKILYAAASDTTRSCEIRTPYYSSKLDKDYYAITAAYGSIDTNKDGKADIVVRLDYVDNDTGSADLLIELTEYGRHAVVAAAKGKAYTIPVTVQLRGRDGISKDAVVKVKVTVKK